MTLQNLKKRLEAVERRVPSNPAGKMTLIIQRAKQISARTKQDFEAVLGFAIEELGTPLTIADVDAVLSSFGSHQI